MKEIPAHWEIKKLRYLGDALIGLTYDPADIVAEGEGTLVLRSSNIQNGRITLDDNVFVSTKIPAELITREKDILICSRNGSRALVGKTAKIEGSAVGTSFGAFTTVFRSGLNDFLYYVFNSQLFSFQAGRFMTTTINQLTTGTLKDLEVPVPPVQEQRRIADFLDRETAGIDRLVTKQNCLVSSLIDRRQAVICQLVTKGPNAAAALTPSGVEWLGEVPKHWEVCRIGSLFREAADVGEDGLPILTVSIHDGVSDRQLDDEELERKFIRIEDTSKYKKVIPSDLVYNMMRAWQGGFGAVLVAGLVSPAYVVARPRRPMVTKFIELLLRTPAAIEEMRCHSYGVADFRLRLYWDHFKTLRVALPPLAEQREIVEAAQRETESIDALIRVIEVQNEKLAEYRSALISAAVTGQIDVRNYHPQEAAVLCQ
jgi:type I restriction enzyme S subunit